MDSGFRRNDDLPVTPAHAGVHVLLELLPDTIGPKSRTSLAS